MHSGYLYFSPISHDDNKARPLSASAGTDTKETERMNNTAGIHSTTFITYRVK